MGDLHSIAYRGGIYSSSQVMGSTPLPFHSPHYSDLPTGYLQDAMFEFSSKRRQLLLCSNDQTKESTYPSESYWNSSSIKNFCNLSRTNNRINSFTGVPLNNSTSGVTESETILTEMQTPLEEAVVVPASEDIDSSSVNAQFIFDKENQRPTFPYGGVERRAQSTVYTFGVVKAGGVEGEVTLEDINQRIVRPPTRPLKHPVGEFACRPKVVVHPHVTGFSGRAVVALTTIQTQGRGTITIIRTRD